MKQLEIRNFPALSYPVQEAVNTLCTNLSFSGEHVKKIMITSSHAAEGKSFLTMNIMRTLARNGKKVALVDGDLRRSYIKSTYELTFENDDEKFGLAHLLAGKVEQEDVIYQTNLEGAYMVPVGREVSNPLPLLNSPKFKILLDHLAEMVDYVLIDAPPVGTVIDAAEIARSCDGTLLVVNYNSVHRKELIEVREQIEQTGCAILGAVLNMVDLDNYITRKYYYKYYSKSYYASSQDGDEKRKTSFKRKRSKHS